MTRLLSSQVPRVLWLGDVKLNTSEHFSFVRLQLSYSIHIADALQTLVCLSLAVS